MRKTGQAAVPLLVARDLDAVELEALLLTDHSTTAMPSPVAKPTDIGTVAPPADDELTTDPTTATSTSAPARMPRPQLMSAVGEGCHDWCFGASPSHSYCRVSGVRSGPNWNSGAVTPAPAQRHQRTSERHVGAA